MDQSEAVWRAAPAAGAWRGRGGTAAGETGPAWRFLPQSSAWCGRPRGAVEGPRAGRCPWEPSLRETTPDPGGACSQAVPRGASCFPATVGERKGSAEVGHEHSTLNLTVAS